MKHAMLFAVVALLSTPLSAQQVAGFSCSGFAHNADGSWSTLQPIQLQSVSVGTGEKLTSGVMLGGIDLARQLDQQCAH